MRRLTDDKGLLLHGRPTDRSGPAFWAQINRERKTLPIAAVEQAAVEHIARKMARQNLPGKPRMRIFPKRNGQGFWYVLYVGRYYIRASTCSSVIRRAAYGPWSDMGSQRRAYAPPKRAGRAEPEELADVKNDKAFENLIGYRTAP